MIFMTIGEGVASYGVVSRFTRFTSTIYVRKCQEGYLIGRRGQYVIYVFTLKFRATRGESVVWECGGQFSSKRYNNSGLLGRFRPICVNDPIGLSKAGGT